MSGGQHWDDNVDPVRHLRFTNFAPYLNVRLCRANQNRPKLRSAGCKYCGQRFVCCVDMGLVSRRRRLLRKRNVPRKHCITGLAIVTALSSPWCTSRHAACARRWKGGFNSLDGDIESRLKSSAALLLDIMTGDAAIAVNRVAMAQACQESSQLGQAVLADWTEQVAQPFTSPVPDGQ